MEFPTSYIQKAVDEISKLPGIGKKTALRLALHLIKQPADNTKDLAVALQELKEKTQFCNTCHVISDTQDCTCKTAYRNATLVCVVEDTPDVLAIHNTGQYNGLYHVLGGKISPIDGIGADDLNITSLVNRVQEEGIEEVILALSVTMEGDTTAFYIMKLLKQLDVKITSIARGIPVGSELEFSDEVTLGRSILTRTNMKASTSSMTE